MDWNTGNRIYGDELAAIVSRGVDEPWNHDFGEDGHPVKEGIIYVQEDGDVDIIWQCVDPEEEDIATGWELRITDQDLRESASPTFDGMSLTSYLDMAGNKITSLDSPVVDSHATNKAYVDGEVSGVQSNLDSHIGTGGTDEHPVVTSTTEGFMSTQDYDKLDGIDDNANYYELEEHNNSDHSDIDQSLLRSDTPEFDGIDLTRHIDFQSNYAIEVNGTKRIWLLGDRTEIRNKDLAVHEVDLDFLNDGYIKRNGTPRIWFAMGRTEIRNENLRLGRDVDLNVGNNRIWNVPTPTSDDHAVNKEYVDDAFDDELDDKADDPHGNEAHDSSALGLEVLDEGSFSIDTEGREKIYLHSLSGYEIGDMVTVFIAVRPYFIEPEVYELANDVRFTYGLDGSPENQEPYIEIVNDDEDNTARADYQIVKIG